MFSFFGWLSEKSDLEKEAKSLILAYQELNVKDANEAVNGLVTARKVEFVILAMRWLKTSNKLPEISDENNNNPKATLKMSRQEIYKVMNIALCDAILTWVMSPEKKQDEPLSVIETDAIATALLNLFDQSPEKAKKICQELQEPSVFKIALKKLETVIRNEGVEFQSTVKASPAEKTSQQRLEQLLQIQKAISEHIPDPKSAEQLPPPPDDSDELPWFCTIV